MKIAILTDTHGNLPALKATLSAIEKEMCDAIYHTGDAIGIGPYPAECLDLLLRTPRIHLIMGNHDAWFAYGLPDPRPSWMSDGELEHQHWVHSCIDPSLRSVVGQWPYLMREELGGIQVACIHYGLTESQRDFVPIVRGPDPPDLDSIFRGFQSDIVFYGHQHRTSDSCGQARYINPGSMGCHREPIARYAILECEKQEYRIRRCGVPYNDRALFEEFERREVPEREFIYRAFFGGRYP